MGWSLWICGGKILPHLWVTWYWLQLALEPHSNPLGKSYLCCERRPARAFRCPWVPFSLVPLGTVTSCSGLLGASGS